MALCANAAKIAAIEYCKKLNIVLYQKNGCDFIVLICIIKAREGRKERVRASEKEDDKKAHPFSSFVVQ